jgi:glutathione S-transferase
MKLFYGGLSPFVRKVMMVAHAKGLADAIKLVATAVDPLRPPLTLIGVNPVGKIPALVLDDGTAFYGSTLIAEFLDALDGAPRFFPRDDAKWPALRRNALADGIFEAGMLLRFETLRPVSRQWPAWRRAQTLKITNALNALESEANQLRIEAYTIGEIALICALGWLDLRFPELQWRADRPGLETWFAAASRWPAAQRTAPTSG